MRFLDAVVNTKAIGEEQSLGVTGKGLGEVGGAYTRLTGLSRPYEFIDEHGRSLQLSGRRRGWAGMELRGGGACPGLGALDWEVGVACGRLTGGLILSATLGLIQDKK